MIDIRNPLYKKLQDLFDGMGADRDATGTDLPVVTFDGAALNAPLNERLLVLLGKALTSLSESGKGAGDDHMPGESDGIIDRVDLDTLLQLVAKVLPEPDEPEFGKALRDRQTGVISIMGAIVNLQQAGRDTGRTIQAVARLTRPHTNDDKNRIELADMPYPNRAEVLKGRVNTLTRWREMVQFKTTNIELEVQFTSVFEQAGAGDQLKPLLAAFRKGRDAFAVSKYFSHRWTNALYGKLQLFSKNLDNAFDTPANLLQKLANQLVLAERAEDFTAAIDGFEPVKKKEGESKSS